MEELINKLMSKGRKPFGNDYVEVMDNDDEISFKFKPYVRDNYTLRQLTSKESLLRQFCCKNKLVKEDDGHITRIINLYKSDESIVDGGWDYHYWLMICSILDESELEEFLIDNIMIEGK